MLISVFAGGKSRLNMGYVSPRLSLPGSDLLALLLALHRAQPSAFITRIH